MEHILLKMLHIYSVPPQRDVLDNFEYSEACGYWKNKITGNPLMLDPSTDRPRTKKEDVETGEDKKGE